MTNYTLADDLISDLHKDARGFRPSQEWLDQWASSDEDVKKAIWDSIFLELTESMERDKKLAQLDLTMFMGEVESTMEICNCNEANAIRILAEGSDTDMSSEQDFEHFLWERGILFTTEGRELMEDYRKGRFK